MKLKTIISGFALLGSTWVSAQELSKRAEYFSGIFDDGAAEISAYHPDTKRLFVVNANIGGVEILDISNLDSIVAIDTIDVSSWGAKSVNSVDIYVDWVALGIEADPKQDRGWIGIYDAQTGDLIDTLSAGFLPDMVKFSHDGKYLMSANEGEPSSDYLNDPEGSITHVQIQGSQVSDWIVNQIEFTSLNSDTTELMNSGVRIPRPHGASVAQDLEPEYITYSDNDSIAFVSLQENNAVMKIDVQNRTIIEVMGLGTKDHSLSGNGLDVIPNDTVNIQSEPVVSMYMPDAISSYSVGGEIYFVTANEGDGREYIQEFSDTTETECINNHQASYPDVEWDEDDGCFYEAYIDEGKLSKLDLDTSVYDSLSIAHLPEKLVVVSDQGDTDGDGLVDQITLFGGRSFSIFNSEGQLVFDSGDDFEQKIFEVNPEYFNTTNDENVLEDRSRKKGPEPEGVEIIQIYDRVFALIGIERQGGVFLYEITDPNQPVMIQYYIDRDFEAVEESEFIATHLGPEGILYIPSEEAPEGEPLVVVSNEVSGTLEFLRFEIAEPVHLMARSSQTQPWIQGDQLVLESEQQVNIFSQDGRSVYEGRVQTLDLNQMEASGVYLIQIQLEDGDMWLKHFK